MARGSIVKRPSGNYCIVFYVNGKQKWKSIGPVRKKAEKALREIMGQVDAGTYRELKPMTFSDFVKEWFGLLPAKNLKPRTIDFYDEVTRVHLIPYFGPTQLTNISPLMIKKFLAKKKESKLSARTVSHLLITLKTILNEAVALGYLKISPAHGIKGPKKERKQMEFLEPDQVQKFLESVDPRYKALFMLAVMTGMRQGEILGLMWEDVDFKEGVIHVRRSLYKGKLQETKTENSDRKVMITPKLAKVLREHKLASPPNELGLVFGNEAGQPMDRHNLVQRYFHPALEKAGLKKVPFHSLRHSFATMLINNQQPLKLVQQLLGHSSIAVTSDVYSHILDATYEEAAEKLDAVVFGNDSTASSRGAG